MNNYVKNNKKGTTMVEAALILPVVILAVMAVIYLTMHMYEKVTMQCATHLEFRTAYNGAVADYARRVDFAVETIQGE